MFILVHQDLVVEEKVGFVTSCEIEWVHIKLTGNKTLLVSSFYMPHWDMSDITELRRSLEGLELDNKKTDTSSSQEILTALT